MISIKVKDRQVRIIGQIDILKFILCIYTAGIVTS